MKTLTGIVVALLLLLVGAFIGASADRETAAEQLTRMVDVWFWILVLVLLLGFVAFAIGKKLSAESQQRRLLKVLVGAFVAVLAGFGSLLASSLVEKQNRLLDDQLRLVRTQNTYFEYRGLEEVFMALRTRYLVVRGELPNRDWRRKGKFSKRGEPEDPERCAGEKRALDAYWQQVFLEWYVLKKLPGVLAERGADSDTLADTLAGKNRADLWKSFYQDAVTRSLLQTRMVQALKSMLRDSPGVFGGEIGFFADEMARLFDEAGPGEPPSAKDYWRTFDQVEPIFDFKEQWKTCESEG